MKLSEKIKKALQPISLYALMNLGAACLNPVLSYQGLSLGLSVSDIILVNGLSTCLSLPSSPITGYIGDKIGYKKMFVVLMGLSASQVFTLYIPTVNTVHKYQIGIDSMDDIESSAKKIKSFSEYVDGNFSCQDTLSFTIQKIICPNSEYDLEMYVQEDIFDNITRKACNQYGLDVCIYNIDEDDSNLIYCEVLLKDEINEIIFGSRAITLGLYLSLRILFKYSLFPGYNIADAIATKMATRINVEWGTICFFGSLANIISPIAVGYMLEYVSFDVQQIDCVTGLEKNEEDFKLPFFFYAGFMVAAMLFCAFFIDETELEPEKELESEPETELELKTVKEEIKKTKWSTELNWIWSLPAIGFYCFLLVYGIILGVFDGFYAIYIAEDLNISKRWVGIIFAVSGATSALFTLVGGFLQKYMGSMNIIILSVLIISSKIVIFGFNREYNIGVTEEIDRTEVPIELLLLAIVEIGIFQWVGVVGYVQKIVPENRFATGLGLAASCAYVAGIAGGNFISMTVNAQIGTRRMYKIFGFIGIACTVLYYVIYHVLIKKAEVKTTKEESIDNIELNPVVNAKETVGL